MSNTPIIDTPILIIGGGPVGFSIALDLASRGTRSVLIERDAGTGLELLAKAGTLNERTMEYFRRLGLVERIADVGFPDDHPRDTVYCTSLNGFLMGRDAMPATRERKPPPQCAEMLRKCPQHLFDPLLADEVHKRGLTQVLYETEFLSLEQNPNGVIVDAVRGASREPIRVRARYVIGCDGASSSVRSALGVGFEGKHLDYSVSAMIRIEELERYHPFGRCERFMFIGPEGTWANLTAVDGRSLWRLTLVGSEDKLQLDQLDFGAVLRRALGRDDVPWEVLRVVPWKRSQFYAQRFTVGRVVLAGDAAHTTSPTGGHGLNTGIGDASDLGWMLDALVQGWGAEGLLAAYDAERRPVAIRNSGSSTRNYAAWVEKAGRDKVLDATPEGDEQRRKVGADLSARLHQEWHSLGVGMGYRYENSPIIVPDGTGALPDDPSEYVQTARPGHRAPHAWLSDGRSTIDLFGRGFTLLRFGVAAPQVDDIAAAASRAGVPLTVVDVHDENIAALYEKRLVLVRPDGMVAWRDDAPPQNSTRLIDIVRGANA